MFLPSNITLKFGDSGDFVAELQRRLALVRCFADDQVNGFYDGPTVNGVTHFQGMHGLHADGVAGPETLRRLNGVIAGDTGSTVPTSTEDTNRTIIEEQALNIGIAQVQAQPDPMGWGAPAAEPVAAAVEPAAPSYHPPEPIAPPAPALQPLPPSPQDMADLHRQQQNPLGDITAMLMANTPPHTPQPPATPEHTQRPQPAMAETAPLQPVPHEQAPALAPAEPLRAAQAEPAAPAQPQGIMQRVVRFANAGMQKMADYFEAKLPNSVLREVQQIGLTMAQSGVKEAPIPTGPDFPTRGPELPSRGPEAQPQQVR